MPTLACDIDNSNSDHVCLDLYTIVEENQMTRTGSPHPIDRDHVSLTINDKYVTYSPHGDKTNQSRIEQPKHVDNPYYNKKNYTDWGQHCDIEISEKIIV